MAWLTPIAAPADVAGTVACSWSARPTGRHRLIPDGCIDVLWLDSGEMWVCGPETAAWDFELPTGRRAVGVRLRPGAAGGILRIDIDSLLDRRIRLEDVLGARVERLASDRIGHSAQPRQALVDRARSWIDASAPVEPVDRGLVAELTESRPSSLDDVGGRLGLSARQLRRRSLRALGYTPTTFVRLVRFQRFLRCAPRSPTVAAAAATAGYADHSHLVRECRAIVGSTPTDLFGWYEQTFPGVADPYKTTGPEVATIDR